MGKSGIPYCDTAWNPFRGCKPRDPGCDKCWAARIAPRLGYGHLVERGPSGALRFNGRIAVERRATAPAVWRKPRVVFVQSMGDLFFYGAGARQTVFEGMLAAPQHTYLLCTKRPDAYFDKDWTREIADSSPKHNWWLGVTVTSEDQASRIQPLWQLAQAGWNTWVSYEPALGPLDLEPWLPRGNDPGIRWVVCGGESGPHARVMDRNWARAARDACLEVGVPFYFKQWGSYADRFGPECCPAWGYTDDCGPRLPTLDGCTWRQTPWGQ
jgi:protein gp37